MTNFPPVSPPAFSLLNNFTKLVTSESRKMKLPLLFFESLKFHLFLFVSLRGSLFCRPTKEPIKFIITLDALILRLEA